MNIVINWWAIVAAVLASLVIGYVWYAKPVFGKVWQKLCKLKDSDLKKDVAPAMIAAIVFGFLMAYVLRHIIVLSQDFYGTTAWATGFTSAFWVWVGFALPALGVNYFFARRSLKLLLIDAGYLLITLIVMGLILAMWA